MIRLRVLSLTLLALPSLLWGQTAVEVQVTPAQLRLQVAQQERLFLSAYDADGNLLTAPTFSFAVSRAGVVSVDKEGTVVGVAPGKASIEVRSGTGTATVAVTVTGPPSPPPQPEPTPVLPAGARLVPTPDSLWLLRLESARVSMALVVPGGSGLGQVQVSWRSSAPEIVTVSETGEVPALQLGQAQIVGTGLHDGQPRAFLLTPLVPGDMNCDGVLSFGDINPFVAALVDGEAAYNALYPNCVYMNADVSGNGSVGFDDINPFVDLLLN